MTTLDALRSARQAMEWATQDNEPLRASTIGKLYQALNAVDEALKGTAAEPPSEALPEIERLKAENASLLESLRAAKEAKREAENEMVAAESQLEWLSDAITGARPIDDFGLSFGVVREAVDLRIRAAAAEQRAEAAEKSGDLWMIRAEAAEQRAADLMGALEESVKLQSHYAELINMHDGGARIGFADANAWLARIGQTKARAALHDEERRQQEEAAWVIERGDSQPSAPTYWAGIDAWSQEHLDAVRFHRKADAERVAAGLRYYPNCRICEHMWVGAAPEAVPALHDEERSAPQERENK